MFARIKQAWDNAYYRWYALYVATIVTLIFGFQMYRYFVAAPASAITCSPHAGAMAWVGAFFYG